MGSVARRVEMVLQVLTVILELQVLASMSWVIVARLVLPVRLVRLARKARKERKALPASIKRRLALRVRRVLWGLRVRLVLRGLPVLWGRTKARLGIPVSLGWTSRVRLGLPVINLRSSKPMAAASGSTPSKHPM